jgi:hypothetical protein
MVFSDSGSFSSLKVCFRQVCRYLLFAYKAINILDEYKRLAETQHPVQEQETKEVVNPGQVSVS